MAQIPRAPVPRPAVVKMPWTVVLGIVVLATYAAFSLYAVFGPDAPERWTLLRCLGAGIAVVSIVIAIGLVAGQRWARIAGVGFFATHCILTGLDLISLAAAACLYGQPATDYYRFKATGELPRRLRR